MNSKAFSSSHRFGKWTGKHHLGRSMIEISDTQAHMRQVQQRVSGRSMIEMLGVLAIIGVLSIGGLYAYRQAMNRYYANQLYDFIFKSVFVFADNCTYADKCQFGTYIENLNVICTHLGAEFCHTEWANSSYAQLPFYPKALWTVNKIDQERPYFYFINLPKQTCAAVVQMNLPHLDYMAFNEEDVNGILHATNGVLSDEQKAIMVKHCLSDEYAWGDAQRLRIGFRIK